MIRLKDILFEESPVDNSPGPKGYAPFVTPERFEQYKAYLQRVFQSSGVTLIKEGVDDKGILKAVFLAGGPGSGKTWVTRGLYGIPNKFNFSTAGLKLVNQDTELEMLLKKYFGTTDLDNMPEELFADITGVDFKGKQIGSSSGMRAFAKDLTRARMEGYVRGRLGVIIDGTGHKYHAIAKRKQRFEDLGYDCYMVFVNTSLEVALKRNMERDRVVPEKIVRDSWHDVQQNLGGFQKLFGRNFLIVDNSKTLGEDEAEKKFESLVKQGVNKFVKAPVKNRIGINWMKRARLLKKQGIK
tara:strand:- start:21 stop:914 length:894 start_codon:yes stop_codon:yes gene_type:complete